MIIITTMKDTKIALKITKNRTISDTTNLMILHQLSMVKSIVRLLTKALTWAIRRVKTKARLTMTKDKAASIRKSHLMAASPIGKTKTLITSTLKRMTKTTNKNWMSLNLRKIFIKKLKRRKLNLQRPLLLRVASWAPVKKPLKIIKAKKRVNQSKQDLKQAADSRAC